MRIEESIVAEWADLLKKEAVMQVVKQLVGMESRMMLSGDSSMKNVWEEFCVQVQEGHSQFYGVYEHTIDGYLRQHILNLSRNAQLALWSTSAQGWDWVYENRGDPESDRNAPLDTDLIIDCLRDEVIEAASNYESQTLYRYIWRADDPQYDDEEGGKGYGDDEVEEDNVASTLVAWYPVGMLADTRLIAVMITPGFVTYKDWIEALADRVLRLTLADEDPENAAVWASRMLDVPEASNLQSLGQALVTDNLNLLEHLNLAVIDGCPFPTQVSQSDSFAQEAIDDTDLELWVELAKSMVSASSLD